MKTASKKFWIIPLLVVMCLLALMPTSFVPLFTAFQSKAIRLYPKSTTDLVMTNQIFVYQIPDEALSFLPFGIHCLSQSPSILEDSQSPIIATTIHSGPTIGIFPDPINNILLPPNSKVSVHIKGKCYFRLFAPGEIGLPFEYFISQETFQVGESRYSQDDLNQIVSNYFEDQFFQNWLEEIPLP